MNENSQLSLRNTAGLLRFNPAPVADSDEGPVALLRWIARSAFQHKAKLIFCIAVGVSMGAYYAQTTPKTYSATASLLLEPHRQSGVITQDLSAQGLDLNRADSELQIIRSERLLTAVFDNLHLENLPELGPKPSSALKSFIGMIGGYVSRVVSGLLQNTPLPPTSQQGTTPDPVAGPSAVTTRQIAFLNFEQHLEARRVGQSYVIEIEYSSTDPKLAATVANAAVSAYLLQAVSFKSQMAIAGTEALQWRLDALAAQVEAARTAVQLGTLPTLATPDADARVIGAALAPLNASGPHTPLMIALGGILGLLAAVALMAIASSFDRKVHDGKVLSRDTGVAFLGSFPDARGAIDASFRPVRQKLPFGKSSTLTAYASAIRNIRTSIEIVSSPNRRNRSLVLAVASWDASSGANSFCVNLSELISRSGRNVTLLKAEKPTESTIGGEEKKTQSLADILTANLSTKELPFLREADSDVSILNIYSSDGDANLFADFRDRRVANIVETASAGGDVVLELPALSGSSDALALAAHADAVVIIVKAGKMKIDEIADAIHQFRQAGANVIGTVINRSKA